MAKYYVDENGIVTSDKDKKKKKKKKQSTYTVSLDGTITKNDGVSLLKKTPVKDPKQVILEQTKKKDVAPVKSNLAQNLKQTKIVEAKKKREEKASTKKTVVNNAKKEIAPLNLKQEKLVEAKTQREKEKQEKKKDDDRTWFKKSSGNTTQTIFGTGTDVAEQGTSGILGMVEGVVDAFASLSHGAYLGQKAQSGHYITEEDFEVAEQIKKDSAEFIKKDLIKEKEIAKKIIAEPMKKNFGIDTQAHSVLGEKSEALVQSGGQLLATAGLSMAGVPWFLTTGASSFGGEMENALNQGATYEEAMGSSLISAGAEILSEKISGGISFGGKTLDAGMTDVLAKNISSKTLRVLSKLGMDMAGEGAEEVVSQVFSNLGSSLYREEDLKDILASEEAFDEYLESFIGGAVLGGVSSGVNTVKSSVKGTDVLTGYTKNEQKVFDKFVEKQVEEQEQDGKKLTSKEKNRIYEDSQRMLEEGEIDIDFIERTLGEESYKEYDSIMKESDEFEELRNTKSGDLTDVQSDRLKELKAKNEAKSYKDLLSETKSRISSQVQETLGDDTRLQESYLEKSRRGESFQADLTKYDSKQAEVIKKAVDSGILNNTRKTHKFVDFVSKISADKGVSFDFTNNERLKESGFAIKDGTVVNGFVDDNGGITININSAKAVNKVVGHEITHILEGTELYDKLQETVFEYAKETGEFDTRFKEIVQMYRKEFEGELTEKRKQLYNQELTADLVGDYIFTDEKFIQNLSANNPNIFQKVYEEIKYMVKHASAGSDAEKKLLEAQRLFEKAYKETSNSTSKKMRYSITESFQDKQGNEYNTAVLLDTNAFDGISPRNWGSELKKIVEKRSTENPFIMPVMDETGEVQQLQFANVKDRVTKDGASEHKVLDKLSSSNDNISKLSVVHIDEVVEISEEGVPYHTDENNHQWLDEKGWLHRTAYVINAKNGNIYQITMDIAKARDGRVILYATNGKTKKVGNVQVNSLKLRGSGLNSNFSDNITQTEKMSRGKWQQDIKSYSLSKVDTDGNNLSIEQQEYFKDVSDLLKDKNGNIKRYYHGTARGDRVGNLFDPNRATSGPMAFFTDDQTIAERYSKDKADTSIAYDHDYDQYETQFRTNVKGKDVSLIDSWKYLPLNVRAKLKERAEHTHYDWDDYETLVYDESTKDANGGFQWQLREAKGNVFLALNEQWLNSGTLYGQEADYIDVLKFIGVNEEFEKLGYGTPYYKDPDYREEKVYEVYLNITNPFDTATVDENFIEDLKSWLDDTDLSVYESETSDADMWDKRNIDPYEWVERLERDFENQTTHAWTSIPDAITGFLKQNGYDGIVDAGGKNTGYGHQVVIPFSSEQIKNIDNQNPTENPDIRYSLGKDKKTGSYNVYGSDIALEQAPVEEVKQNDFAEDYAPLRNESIARTTQKYEAIKSEPVKSEPRMVRVKDAPMKSNEHSQVAKVLTEEPKVEKKKNKFFAQAMELVADKGFVFENLAKKTKNRELEAKWNSTRYAEGMAQDFIGKGEGNVRALNDVQKEVEKAGLSKELSEYLYHLHNIDRMNLADRYDGMENKPVFGDAVTSEMSRTEVAKLEAKNPALKKYANEIYSINNHLRQMLVDGGVISRETADLWSEMYPHYVPIRRVGEHGFDINVPLDTRKTGINAPVKRATGGSSDIMPLFDTMAQRTLQTYRAVARNRFGVELKNTLGTVVGTETTDVDGVMEGLGSHEELLQKGKNGSKPTFTVFEGGEKVTFEIDETMYDALKSTSEALTYTNPVTNAISNFHRNVLTQYNPVFTMRNIIKDTQDVLINSQHPIKTYANYPKALAELTAKGKWYKEYAKNGGEQNTYFDKKTNTFVKDKSTFTKVIGFPLNAVESANNFVERLPRLAEYIASREAGRSIEVSMLDSARVTTNFSAGGDLTKFLNRNGATFLNASVQGAMQQVRNIREAKMNGLKGWVKLATKGAIASIPIYLLNSMLWDDDEEYEELSDYVKQNYYVVAKFGDGQFVRIPKGRTLSVIQNAFDQTMNSLTGDDEIDLDAFTQLAITNLAPNNPFEDNILAPIVQVANNETWYGGDLVPTRLQDLPNEEQYDESTDDLSRWLGEKTGQSPYKINYLLEQYSGAIGDVFLPMITPEAESGDDSMEGQLLAPLRDAFTTDSTLNNQNISDFYDTKDELTKVANSSGATNEDVLSNKYINSVNSEIGKLYGEKREIQNSNLPNSEKYNRVREIQKEINALAEESLNTYPNVQIDGDYATVGDRQYIFKDGSWTKLNDEQVKKQDEVTNGLDIAPSEYWSNKKEYDFAYKDEGKYSIAAAIGGYDVYEVHKDALNEIRADKDSNGKTISGSAKEKKANYINGLDLDYGQKIILYRSLYDSKADKEEYNQDILDYLNSREDLSYEEVVTILEELDFKVYDDGTVEW